MRHTRRRQSGSVLVEMAVVTPMLALLLIGTMQFGYAFYIYNRIEKAVMDGARYAALRTFVEGSESSFNLQVSNVVKYGNPDGVGSVIAPGFGAATVNVQFTLENGYPQRVTVSVTGYTIPLALGAWNLALTGKPSSTFPYLGRYVIPI